MTPEELASLKITGPDEEIRRLAKARWDTLAKPVDGLGYLEDMICRAAAVQGSVMPDLSKKALVIMCADNGVVSEGVSQTGREVTYEVAELMGKRRSSVGVMTGGCPLDIFVYDVGIDAEDTPKGVTDKKISRGTADFLKKPAMSSTECMAAILTGMDAAKELKDNGYGITATGEMGIGNTTTSTALMCALTGVSPEEYTGRGSGLTDEGLKRKLQVISEGLEKYAGKGRADSPEESFKVLCCLGGLDIAALAGVFIGGALYGMPVVVDGLISAAAALAAERIVPGCREYMLASHAGREKGAGLILDELSLRPVIHADLALGEGTGAVMLFPLLDMACALYSDGTAFEETSIEKYERYGR